ncbi:SMI1/KNR4 family protein [Tenacibaculum sp. ZS6-P6]|uniref:SMI1/KNR4 family protein n=1 Tax=Tenacibaculum sp. ZS6-P6 TaxID=3447503 RepID=UPI003F9E3814
MKATSLKAFFITLIFILSFGGLSIYISKRSKSNAEKKNVAEKLQMVKKVRDQIDSVTLDTKTEDYTMEQIIKLLDDYEKHQKIGKKLKNTDIKEFELKLDLIFPKSYITFLEHFGNGGSVYNNKILSIEKPIFLSKYLKTTDRKIEDEDGFKINTNSILCLTSEDSKDGIWCWLTEDESNKNGEWPIAYFNNKEKKLYYGVDNFNQWLDLLLTHKSEISTVISNDSTSVE